MARTKTAAITIHCEGCGHEANDHTENFGCAAKLGLGVLAGRCDCQSGREAVWMDEVRRLRSHVNLLMDQDAIESDGLTATERKLEQNTTLTELRRRGW